VFAPGELLAGRYHLLRRIGEGAMGTVWVAHNDLLDIDVAIKVLRIGSKTDATRAYKRLLREARATARLGHPGIVRVFDFGQTEDKSPYIVMELLEGESLAEQMTRQPRLGMVQAVQLLLPIIDALSVAHDRGIVHRDIKPENIFLSRDQYGRVQPKIVDFGVARLAEAGRSLTRSGALLGTPDYMAPEQARGELGIDHRVDLWAICIVLYELLTGHRPFAREAGNYLAVLRAISQDAAASIRNFGAGDDALWLIIERGLKKRAADRWGSMRELGEALALWLYEQGTREDMVGASLKTTWLQAGLDGVKIEAPSMYPPSPLSIGRPKPPPPPRQSRLVSDAGAESVAATPLAETGASEYRGLATVLEPLPARVPVATGVANARAAPEGAAGTPRRFRAVVIVMAVLALAATAMFVRRAVPSPAALLWRYAAHAPAAPSAPVAAPTDGAREAKAGAPGAVTPEPAEAPSPASTDGEQATAEDDLTPAVREPAEPASLEPVAPPAAKATNRHRPPSKATRKIRSGSTRSVPRGALPSANSYDFGF
jgi:serine/threonine-protein kinase